MNLLWNDVDVQLETSPTLGSVDTSDYTVITLAVDESLNA